MSTLLTILGFIIYIGIFTVALPYMFEGFSGLFEDSSRLWIQFVVLAVAILISAALHFATYKICSKRLEQVDF